MKSSAPPPAPLQAGRDLSPLLPRLSEPDPLVAVELRPPRLGMGTTRSMSVWIDMHHAVQRLARQDTFILLTDDAAGDHEEESLGHLAANLGGSADLGAVVPFLTCKHPLEYCRMFARRASGLGVAAVAVVGGDHAVGPERCVPHGKDLRRILRADQPGLPLGGWANPHRDPVRQARFVAAKDYTADFVLTQIVSHHSLGCVERFRSELARLGVDLPVVYGVFHYHSANARTLDYLGRYFPVPAREITREFEGGATAEEICLRSVRGLRAIGADKVYVSNLRSRDVARRLEGIGQGMGVGGSLGRSVNYGLQDGNSG
ncbi:MAG: methylenetetrahydrofolate reductase [Gemmatimonadota bacterium]|nr:methylenetetrahydrofolate reductase [Gemmatimonadota bacterium]